MANNPPEVIWNGFQADGYVLDPGSDAEARAGRRAPGGVRHRRWRTAAPPAVNDTRFYGLYHRMPALCYGPRGENHHGFDECAHLPTLQGTTLAIACFVADWCGVRERV